MERQEQIERFTQAIRVLTELPEDCEVNQDSWRQCRMVACAGGWIAQDEWFNEQGMHFFACEPNYDDQWGFSALQTFFGLTKEDVNYLFNTGKYPFRFRRSRSYVIQRFQNYLSLL